ncbi:MAG: Holliday junction resolvase RuvX [Gammaproteobacteria bacterium]|nr:Holliday junction resolvase RuvX [Gammaproteobacteria bacterium]
MPEKLTPKMILSFDFGDKSIGVACGQAITRRASPLKALRAKNGQPNWDEVGKLFKEWQPDLLLVGNPLNMDGTEQELTLRAQKFAKRLHGRFALPFELVDERLTTAEAKQRLFEDGGFRALQKGAIDSESAVIILESWFEQNADRLNQLT